MVDGVLGVKAILLGVRSRVVPIVHCHFPYLQQCFVVEDSLGICGYVVAASDAKKFVKMTELTWIPEMVEKYPKDAGDASEIMAGRRGSLCDARGIMTFMVPS